MIRWKVCAGVAITISSILFAGSSHAADVCEAVALRDVPAMEDPTSILSQGEHDPAVTQYRVNKKTGVTSFCSHGGYCYPRTSRSRDTRSKPCALRTVRLASAMTTRMTPTK